MLTKGKLIPIISVSCLIVTLSVVALIALNRPKDNPESTTFEAILIKLRIGNPIMTVNGVTIPIDDNGTVPFVENNRTLLPIRTILETVGGNVFWDAAAETAILTHGISTIKLTIGSNTAFLNDIPHMLDVTPVIINDSQMFPIRFIAESFGFEVGWESSTETVSIAMSRTD